MSRDTTATPDISEKHLSATRAAVNVACLTPSDPLFGAGIAGVADKKRTKSGVLQRGQLIQQRLEAVMKGLQNLYTGLHLHPRIP